MRDPPLTSVMAFYSSTIFVEGGFSTSQALFASIGFGALNFVYVDELSSSRATRC